MGITKIMLQYDVCVDENLYDVLVPLPANADVCMKEIGIDDFEDADDQWDYDFRKLLEGLVGEIPFYVSSVDPQTRREEVIASAQIGDIQGYLAHYDHIHFVLVAGNKTIRFTRGHEILWLRGFERDEITSLNFEFEIVSNNRIKELF